MFDMIDPWMKRQVADQQTVAKIRGDLEKANRKAEDQDFLLQKIEAKLVAFDDIYKKLASFVGPRPIADFLQENVQQLEQVKIENEFNRLKSYFDMQRQEITSLFKKDELIVSCDTSDFVGQND